MATPKLELFSFNTCPYLQSIIINLEEKDIPYSVTYIDLDNKPDWLTQGSPMGKVPALKMGDIYLFESTAINEFIDELKEPRLHPANLVEKAVCRAWLVFTQDLTINFHRLLIAKDKESYDTSLSDMKIQLVALNNAISTPFFNGEKISLVDIDVAPLLVRFSIIEDMGVPSFIEDTANIKGLANNLSRRISVKKAISKDFRSFFTKRIKELGGYILNVIESSR